MFKYQLKRLYVKYFVAILIILAILFAGKFVTVKFFYKEQPLNGRQMELFDSHVEATIGKSVDEKLEYYYEKKAPQDKMHRPILCGQHKSPLYGANIKF